MSSSPLLQASLFLVSTFFDLAIFALMLRFFFQLMSVNFFHPICQSVVKVTTPLLWPLSKLPSIGRVNMAVLVLLLVMDVIKLGLLSLIESKVPHVSGLILWSIGDLFNKTLNLFFYALLFQALLSWLRPGIFGPGSDILYRLTEPLVAPFQRRIPPVAGIDFSYMAVFIVIKLIEVMVTWPLVQYGQWFSFN